MNPLLKILADNRGKGVFRAEKSAVANEATLYLYDAIVTDDYWGGVSATSFVKELAQIDAEVIHLRINSPGGEVFAAQAMAQAIREKGARVVAHVDGYAASAASFLALAADEVRISEGGFFMIHKAHTIAWGNADALKETAALLDKVDGVLVAGYAKETGQDAQQIADWMAAETWFSAEEAVANGFADSIDTAAAKASANWNLSAWANAPKVDPVTPPEENKDQPAPPPAASHEAEDKEHTEHLRRRLAVMEKQAA